MCIKTRILKIASMIRMKNVITIFLRHNWLGSESCYFTLFIYVCMYICIYVYKIHYVSEKWWWCSSCIMFAVFLIFFGTVAFFVLILRDTLRLFSKWFFPTVNYSLFQMHFLGLQVLHHKSLSNIIKRFFLVIYFILCLKCNNSLSPVMLITLVERKDEM